MERYMSSRTIHPKFEETTADCWSSHTTHPEEKIEVEEFRV